MNQYEYGAVSNNDQNQVPLYEHVSFDVGIPCHFCCPHKIFRVESDQDDDEIVGHFSLVWMVEVYCTFVDHANCIHF